MISEYTLIPVSTAQRASPGTQCGGFVSSAINESGQTLSSNDIVVVTQKIVSICEGALYEKSKMLLSEQAVRIARTVNRDPYAIEAALREASEIVVEHPVMITRLRNGIVTDMSGVDVSNAPPDTVVVLPRNPDKSARLIREHLKNVFGHDVGVIVSDTQGRPWRRGAANVCIGASGVPLFTVNRGRRDMYGRILKASLVCIADEIAAAAELLMGQAAESIPIVIVRGLDLPPQEQPASSIVRPRAQDLFSRPNMRQ
ncbi:MAG: coenzyme F420-0:L-glutamate ligase [Candidatus Thorarchaeota archaeon]